MVKLTRIYTRGGDQGETSLASGRRVPKHDQRVTAYGAVDEANAAIGICRLHCSAHVDTILSGIQNDLFDVGADLATPLDSERKNGEALRVSDHQIERLEIQIDGLNNDMAPLESFVLPAGCAAAAELHVARTVVRRAEREASLLAASEEINFASLRYLNRLSDLLFVLARHENDHGRADVLWVPGKNR